MIVEDVDAQMQALINCSYNGVYGKLSEYFERMQVEQERMYY